MHLRHLLFIALFTLLGACASKDIDENLSETALYQQAQTDLDNKNYSSAVSKLKALESRYPFGRYAEQAQLELIFAYYKNMEPEAVRAAADRFIKLHPNHPNVDYMYYLKGLINFNENLGFMGHISQQDMTERDPQGARESFDAFKELVTRFPDSKYTPDATMRMKYLVNALASHEVHVARYYIKRTAYVAAANRAQYALLNYPEAPAIEEALYIMVYAYGQMGMDDLREDTERVMRKNFPNSVYYTQGLDRKTPWWKLW